MRFSVSRDVGSESNMCAVEKRTEVRSVMVFKVCDIWKRVADYFFYVWTKCLGKTIVVGYCAKRFSVFELIYFSIYDRKINCFIANVT